MLLEVLLEVLLGIVFFIVFLALMVSIVNQEAKDQADKEFRKHYLTECKTCGSAIMDYDEMINCRECGELICDSCANGHNPDGDICAICIRDKEEEEEMEEMLIKVTEMDPPSDEEALKACKLLRGCQIEYGTKIDWEMQHWILAVMRYVEVHAGKKNV